MEYESIALVDEGQPSKAVGILESSQYWDQKDIYAQGLKDYINRKHAKYGQALSASSATVQIMTSNVSKLVEMSRKIVIGFVVAALILAAGIARLVSRSVSNPLKRLQNALAIIGRGDFDHKLNSASNDELGLISQAVDGMTDKLQKSTTSIDNLNATNQQLQASEQQLQAANQQLHSEIAERKRTEEERARMQEELFQSQKLESIGMLAGGIAHDFNNLLQGILGYTQLMKVHGSTKDYTAMSDNLNQVEVAAEKAVNLTQQLLSYARKGKYEVRTLSLSKVVDQVVGLMKRTFKKNIDIRNDIPGNLPSVAGDKNQLHQVIMNLCVNAGDAMPDGGTLTISTDNRRISPGTHIQHENVVPGDYICLSIKDTGEGMTDKVRESIFEPFFTTKETGKGTGLGLSMVTGIVKNHGGFIEVDSAVGQGTEFRIFLPVAGEIADEGTVATSAPANSETTVAKKGKRVLVVDDEDVVRNLAEELIKSFECEPLPAEDGMQAIQIFERERGNIDIVMLDMIMPGFGGVETFRRLRAIDADIPVFLFSGYSQDEAVQELLNEGASGFVQKPYRIEDLAEVIESV